MRVPLDASSLDLAQLQRFFRRSVIDQAVKVLRLCSLAIIVLVVISLLWAFYQSHATISHEVSQFEEKLSSNLGLAGAGVDGGALKHDSALFSQKSPFGAIGIAPPPKAGPTPKPASLTPLLLIGTFVSQGQDPWAIIEEKKKNIQEIFNLNDTVFGDAKLTAIYTDRVEILRNGQKEVLLLDTNQEAGSGTDSGSAGANDEFVVEEGELDRALENLPLLLTQARAVPFFKEGRAVGLRLFAIRAGSLFEKIGLQNGDILKSVNGNSLADLSQAMQLFQKLKEERSIALVLERNNSERQFRYQIR